MSRTPQPGDDVILSGVGYRDDGLTGDGDHLTSDRSDRTPGQLGSRYPAAADAARSAFSCFTPNLCLG